MGVILQKLHIGYNTLDDLIADFKHLDGILNELDPTRTRKFVIQDENGNDILYNSHGWDVTPLFYIEEVPAEIDEDGEVITPAVLSDRPRANVALREQRVMEVFNQLKAGGYLEDLPNGSSFVDTEPETPAVGYAGYQEE